MGNPIPLKFLAYYAPVKIFVCTHRFSFTGIPILQLKACYHTPVTRWSLFPIDFSLISIVILGLFLSTKIFLSLNPHEHRRNQYILHVFSMVLLGRDLKCYSSTWFNVILFLYLVYPHFILVLRIPSFYSSTSHNLILFQYFAYPHFIAALRIPSFCCCTSHTLILF